MGEVSVLLLTLAAGQGLVEGRLGVNSMSVAFFMGIEKARPGCRFQCHGPLHIVIVGPYGTYLVEGQNLLEVHAVQLHPEGVGGVHPAGGLGHTAPNTHGTSDKPLIGGRSILRRAGASWVSVSVSDK